MIFIFTSFTKIAVVQVKERVTLILRYQVQILKSANMLREKKFQLHRLAFKPPVGPNIPKRSKREFEVSSWSQLSSRRSLTVDWRSASLEHLKGLTGLLQRPCY